jgi:pimeloyl-ACP methyl ester carboxylesterase
MTMSSRVELLNVVDQPGDEPAFVLMHGFPDDHHIYDRVAPLFAPRRVVTFDFTGYGASARSTAERPAPANPRADLPTVIDALELERVVFFGHDASGPIAIDYVAYLGPALARRLAEYFAVADVVVVPGASHWPQWDQPEDVAVQLLAMGAAEQPRRDAGSLQ